jgi:hypothetical protein
MERRLSYNTIELSHFDMFLAYEILAVFSQMFSAAARFAYLDSGTPPKAIIARSKQTPECSSYATIVDNLPKGWSSSGIALAEGHIFLPGQITSNIVLSCPSLGRGTK